MVMTLNPLVSVEDFGEIQRHGPIEQEAAGPRIHVQRPGDFKSALCRFDGLAGQAKTRRQRAPFPRRVHHRRQRREQPHLSLPFGDHAINHQRRLLGGLQHGGVRQPEDPIPQQSAPRPGQGSQEEEESRGGRANQAAAE